MLSRRIFDHQGRSTSGPAQRDHTTASNRVQTSGKDGAWGVPQVVRYALATEYRFGRYAVQLAERRFLVENQSMPVRARAFDVLVALINRAGNW